ncbi:MAG: ferredoxin [Candidatus Aenigmarchaeota archaeon]|nr:ferredoxin [Candidatus Aenigmarchaeota archaeon]
MALKIDAEKCIGCGACVSFCSDCFEMNDGGKAEVIAQKCDSCDLNDSPGICPVQAITV